MSWAGRWSCQTGPMALDADVQELLDSLAATNAPAITASSVAEARALRDAAPKAPGPALAHVVDRTIPGPAGEIPVRVYCTTTPTDHGRALVVFFHGGGWVLSNIESHDHMARRIAAESDALVVSVEYRLAPEAPFPAPHDDCWAATRWLADNGVSWGGDPGRLVVCGDSAGGNLAAGVALRARAEGLDISLQALIYPCIDDRQEAYRSHRDNGVGYFLTAADMAWFWDCYVPPEHRDNPYAVPARAADLSDLAPALVLTAEYDPLRDEGEAYAQRLIDAGVPTTLTRYPGVVHGFATRWNLMARADDAHAELAAAIRAVC